MQNLRTTRWLVSVAPRLTVPEGRDLVVAVPKFYIVAVSELLGALPGVAFSGTPEIGAAKPDHHPNIPAACLPSAPMTLLPCFARTPRRLNWNSASGGLPANPRVISPSTYSGDRVPAFRDHHARNQSSKHYVRDGMATRGLGKRHHSLRSTARLGLALRRRGLKF
jgi:hypothetical protein